MDKLKQNQKSGYYLQNSAFWGWLSMESRPQNLEFRNNPENFHPCIWTDGLTIDLLNLDLSHFRKHLDPDQLSSNEAIWSESTGFHSDRKYMFTTGMLQFNSINIEVHKKLSAWQRTNKI